VILLEILSAKFIHLGS